MPTGKPFPELIGDADLFRFELDPVELHSRDGVGNGLVDVPADDAAQDDEQHGPEGYAHEPGEFEYRVQQDEDRATKPEKDVDLEPIVQVPPAPHEPQALAQGVREERDHEEGAEDPQEMAHGPALAQHRVQGQADPFCGRGEIIIPSEIEQAGDGKEGDDINGLEAGPHSHDVIAVRYSISARSIARDSIVYYPTPSPRLQGAELRKPKKPKALEWLLQNRVREAKMGGLSS
jgi:hypothetical protein